jgi:hypothetical protein
VKKGEEGMRGSSRSGAGSLGGRRCWKRNRPREVLCKNEEDLEFSLLYDGIKFK